MRRKINLKDLLGSFEIKTKMDAKLIASTIAGEIMINASVKMQFKKLAREIYEFITEDIDLPEDSTIED